MTRILLKFGKRVKVLRNSKNISQEKLAELADLHRTYISQIESGIRNVSLKNIEKISKALKINVSDLFNFNNNGATK